jgi:hypothetical protein
LNLALARVACPSTILHSIKAGLDGARPFGLVRIILGDTLITDSFDSNEDFVYTGPVDYSRRWCLVSTRPDGVITGYVDKQQHAGPHLRAIAGYYHLLDGEWFYECVQASLHALEQELSDVLRRYGERRPIHAQPAAQWYDFGHIDTLADARRRLISSRSFNRLRVDPLLNTITKTSTYNEKLADELNWYLQLPKELQVLIPRLLEYENHDGKVSIKQEFYGYSSLAELFVFGNLTASTWGSVLRRIFDVQRLFRSHKGELTLREISRIYVDKTISRIDELRASGPEWMTTVSHASIIYNGRELVNVPHLLPQICRFGEMLARSAEVCIVHGDLCFSNILFDFNNQIVRLVDPRGDFGRKGIYGDPRYDAAKLRHSVCGLYDFIVFDMFSLTHQANEFTATIYCENHREIGRLFDELVVESGFDSHEIQFIEGLLFLSMVPLHAGKPQRQKMMYCRGLELLNDVLTAYPLDIGHERCEYADCN